MTIPRLFALGVATLALFVGAAAHARVKADVGATNMNGAKEVPGPGDPNGSGSAKINLKPDKGEVCWQLLWSNVSGVTAAHIHKGVAGESGPIKVTFFDVGPPGDMGSGASGCTDVAKRQQRKIEDKPKNYYVNFHTTEFPDGAIRAQLK